MLMRFSDVLLFGVCWFLLAWPSEVLWPAPLFAIAFTFSHSFMILDADLPLADQSLPRQKMLGVVVSYDCRRVLV